MTHEVVHRIHETGELLAAHAPESERLGRLADPSAKLLRDCGVMRLLQPPEHGGYCAHPRDFAEAVMAAASYCGAAGWVAGVVGVHPWEMAMADPRLRAEVWGADQDTWIASPYAPTGIARPVAGGYRLSGRWQFSSGTDHCSWIFLGALVGDDAGRPTTPVRQLHVVLPRADYTIVDDSWDVVGLKGTGSKDILVADAFVPDYRVFETDAVVEGRQAELAGRTEPLYRMPFWVMFPLGITAATIGICEGALRTHLDYQRGRVLAMGTKVRDDPYLLAAISEAASEIAASRAQLLGNIDRIHQQVADGTGVSWAERATCRRDQVRAAWRAVSAVDEVFARSGGNALRLDNPLQRFWRDAHAGLNHAIHTSGPAYHAAALSSMDVEVPVALRGLI
jgi:3-hydroxy-9,10-secoandrosta-1,3,5(10)-triene-9,17-dione monooxygenase